jgi:hypothetical protein
MPDPAGNSCRLLAACAASYAIGAPGGPEASSQYAAAGFLAPPQALHAGSLEGFAGCLVGETAQEWVVAFRGTIPPSFSELSSAVDWMADFNATPVRVHGLPGLLHDGFQRAVALLEDSLVAALARLGASGKPLWITGHSKGGAMAPIAAAKLRERHQIQAQGLRLFAAPKPGNDSFARYFARVVPDTVRYEYQDDLVPHMPPSPGWIEKLSKLPVLGRELRRLSGLEYAHVGTLQFIDWERRLRGESPELEHERSEHLAQLLVELRLKTIADDHSLLASYAAALCPALVQ